MAVNHYENFPVASLLLPEKFRPAVVDIYRFARAADDIADEGHSPPGQRLAELDVFRSELDRVALGQMPTQPLFVALKQTVATYGLPLQPFHDLLDAFSQDVTKTRYRDFAEVQDYCRRSANPVGRLLLHLYRAVDETNLRHSDAICTALQLINFWQDAAIDWKKNRIYLPQDEMSRFGVTEDQIATGRCDAKWRALMDFQVRRSRELMLEGAPLGRALPGRIGLELRVIVAGGLRILEKIERVGYDIFHRRPTLEPRDWPLMMWHAAVK
ncbi:MAG: squalene synthase HpnC [Rhodocyclaceae bacterium]